MTSASAGSSAPATSTASAARIAARVAARDGLPGARDRNAAERDVRLLDRQAVQARDRVEREHGLRHQLRRRPGPGHACDCRRTAHAATPSVEEVFERDGAAGVGPLLEAAERRVELVPCELDTALRARTRKRVAAGVLAERKRHTNADVAGSMIWYVRASFSIPSWWMPASCANAFAPTTALFGCTA